jgi:hypothetical protein
MAVGMIVCLEFLLEIPDLVLNLLELFFEGFDTLISVGMFVTTLLLGHRFSLQLVSYVALPGNQ